MEKNNTVIAVFEHHAEADKAIRKLADSGFPINQLSIIGKGYHTEEKVVGFYNMGDRVKFWGKRGVIWGGLWGFLSGGLYMTLPVIGPVVVIGYFAAIVLATLESAILVGGVSALTAALVSLDVPNDSVVAYEEAVKANDFIILAQGTAEETERARAFLNSNGARKVDCHHCKSDNVKHDVKPIKIAS